MLYSWNSGFCNIIIAHGTGARPSELRASRNEENGRLPKSAAVFYNKTLLKLLRTPRWKSERVRIISGVIGRVFYSSVFFFFFQIAIVSVIRFIPVVAVSYRREHNLRRILLCRLARVRYVLRAVRMVHVNRTCCARSTGRHDDGGEDEDDVSRRRRRRSRAPPNGRVYASDCPRATPPTRRPERCHWARGGGGGGVASLLVHHHPSSPHSATHSPLPAHATPQLPPPSEAERSRRARMRATRPPQPPLEAPRIVIPHRAMRPVPVHRSAAVLLHTPSCVYINCTLMTPAFHPPTPTAARARTPNAIRALVYDSYSVFTGDAVIIAVFIGLVALVSCHLRLRVRSIGQLFSTYTVVVRVYV